LLEIGDVIRMGTADGVALDALRAEALALGPWRKGPFEVCGLRIDAHWDSAPKWHRALAAAETLRGRTVCDVGCNNGYYLYRMAEAGASEILGIDPVEQFERQFQWLQSFESLPRTRFERKGFEDLSGQFDTIFCMGVLYHVRSPHALFERLRDCLAKGGTLILETISADIGEACIVPAGRYAGAAGIHWLPGPQAVINWLRRCGFSRAELVGTDPARGEQRRTEFADLACMDESIEDGRTKEGYPAPWRSIFRVRR
jgi:tRNA (mo5U34)-methyltransferase